jgi:hypothetical protein
VSEQRLVNHKNKCRQANASHCGACSIHPGNVPAAERAIYPRLLLLLQFVLLNERDARGGNSRKSQKQATNVWSKLPADNADHGRNRTSCHETYRILPPGSPAHASEIHDNLALAFTHHANHNAKAAAALATSPRTWRRIINQFTQDAYKMNAIAPATMECASMAAYADPSRKIVRPRVASAIEGAAPNRPVKLWGLNKSLRLENKQTSAPPTANR